MPVTLILSDELVEDLKRLRRGKSRGGNLTNADIGQTSSRLMHAAFNAIDASLGREAAYGTGTIGPGYLPESPREAPSVPDVAGRDVLKHTAAERALKGNWRPWLEEHGVTA